MTLKKHVDRVEIMELCNIGIIIYSDGPKFHKMRKVLTEFSLISLILSYMFSAWKESCDVLIV